MGGRHTSFNRGRYNDFDSIEIAGPFDSLDERIEAIAQSIFAEGKKSLVVNLAEVTFMTSSGIASIVRILKKIQTVGGILYITGATEDMLTLLSLARLEKYVQVI